MCEDSGHAAAWPDGVAEDSRPQMKRFRSLALTGSEITPGIAAGIVAALALAAAVIVGLQRTSVAQSEAVISLDAPVSFPVDI